METMIRVRRPSRMRRIAAIAAVLAIALNSAAVASHAEAPADCRRADQTVRERLAPYVREYDIKTSSFLRDLVGSLKQARALCGSGEPVRGLLLYAEIMKTITQVPASPAEAADDERDR